MQAEHMREHMRPAAVARFALSMLSGMVGKLAEGLRQPDQGCAHNHSFINLDGTPLPLAHYKGQVLLVVNVASRCGFEGQCEGLEQLYQRYRDRGFALLGVPSDDFGEREQKSEIEIKHYFHKAYQATFPITRKVAINSATPHSFYDWARRQGLGGVFGAAPRWNFHKYLIARDGRLLGSYTPMTRPGKDGLIDDIETALAQPAVSGR